MSSTNDETNPAVPDGEGAGIDPTETVIVSTGEGNRFHCPGWLVFQTACKTEFDRPVREVSAYRAVRDGFTPCERPSCFG